MDGYGLPQDDDAEGERLRELLSEIGEDRALMAATILLGAMFHSVDPYTFRERLAELTVRLVGASMHPDGTFCTGVVLPLLDAAAVAAAMIMEAQGMGTDPAGETVTPRYIAEVLATRLAPGDADWTMVQGTADKIRRGILGETDAPTETDDAPETDEADAPTDARSFTDRYRALSDDTDAEDEAEDAAVVRDAAQIAALNAALGLDIPLP